MYGLLESMDDGVMAWNEQGVLQFLNVQAARLLHLDAQASQGKNIADLVTLPALLRRAIKHARGLNHVEVTFESQHQFVDAVITLKPIVEAQGNSFILLLHPVEQMPSVISSCVRPTFNPAAMCTFSCGSALPNAVSAAMVAISRLRKSSPGLA